MWRESVALVVVKTVSGGPEVVFGHSFESDQFTEVGKYLIIKGFVSDE